ncbi:MAG: preprotein translocase subunit SecE [Acholeplasmataceae bacterium]
MAIKEKNNELLKSKLLEVIKTEYRWENLLLGFLAVISAGLALMLIIGNSLLSFDPNTFFGQGNNGKIFAWVLLIISIFGLGLVIYPFFLPAVPEIKKITWPDKKKFIDNSIRTVLFLLIITLIILVFDIIILRLISILPN